MENALDLERRCLTWPLRVLLHEPAVAGNERMRQSHDYGSMSVGNLFGVVRNENISLARYAVSRPEQGNSD